MSRRPRKQRATHATLKRFVPKPGPGDLYVREFLSARTGREERFRNIGEHPLTLAHARGKISDDHFAAGEKLRRLCWQRGASGRDSTEMTRGSGGSGHTGLSDMQIDAVHGLEKLRSRIKTRDWIILEKFCGEGWSMAESVRAATLCHPSGILFRMLEALDELVAACGGPARRSA